ncbi:MAG TPA: immunoglobulin domain-containing protein, partial [Verrucomicrobiae bacterium]|nr:immunoglobulin domain-containing protein [Verrucomicrobiae bacterium]
KWQFINTLSVNWVRLNALNHPQIDLSKPISFRVLVLPVGVTTGDMSVSTIADQTQNTGGSATFNVSATGIGPFTYQWSFNDTNVISGATSSTYTASNLTTNNAGRYTVAVGDGNGCTNYSSAHLTVNTAITPVSITITYNGANVILNWPGSHTLQSAPSATGTYTDVAGPVLTGPYSVPPSGSALFFRLRN